MFSFRPRLRVTGILPAALLLGSLAAPAGASVIYVSAASPAANPDGASWATAYRSVQAAADAAATGDEVWVARGVYGPVTVGKPLSLYGGFAGTETARDARAPRGYRTVIDAALGDTGVVLNSAATLDGFSVRNANRLTGTGVRVNSTGCTVRMCFVSQCGSGVVTNIAATLMANVLAANGTGAACTGTASLLVSNVLCGNDVGVSAGYGVPRVVNNTFLNNATGLACDAVSGLAFANNAFAWNTLAVADVAGGTTMTVNNAFYGNGADSTGAGGIGSTVTAPPDLVNAGTGDVRLGPASPLIDAGATQTGASGWIDVFGNARVNGARPDIGASEFIGVSDPLPPLVVRVNAVSGDDSLDGSTWPQAMKTLGGALEAMFGRTGEIWVSDGRYGGMITMPAATTVVGGFAGDETERAQRHGTYSLLDGLDGESAVTVRSIAGQATLAGLWITGARIGAEGLGLAAVHDSVIAGNGDGAFGQAGSLLLEGCTLVDNARGVVVDGGNASAVNTIIAHNGSGLHMDAGAAGSIALSYSCIGVNGVDFEGVTDPGTANGVLHADPMLADWQHGNLHIQPTSPCVNAGNSGAVPAGGTDIDGQARVQGAAVDIGADESDGTLWTAAPRVVRVRPDGDDSNSGASWGLALRSIQAGIDAAVPGGEVWVAGGDYAESLRLRPMVHVFGGFAGTETARDARTPSAHPSVVSPGAGLPGLSLLGGYTAATADGLTVRDAEIGVQLDGASPLITGVTITGCRAAAQVTDGAPVFAHNTITRNFDGLRFQGGTPVIRGNTVVGQSLYGIGVWDAAADVRDNAIQGAGDTGLYAADATVTAVNNTLTANATAIRLATGTLSASNNLLAYNLSGLTILGTATTSFYANAFWSNATPFTGVADPTGINGNSTVDPGLASAASGGVHLAAASPLIGAGSAAAVTDGETDIDGEPRLTIGRVDIGADQYSAATVIDEAPAVAYVRPEGSDSADGRSWATAKQTIPAAIASIRAGEVWVAGGAYSGPFQLYPFISLYGGFRGSETDRGGRSVNAANSLLDFGGAPNGAKVRGGYTFGTIDGFAMANATTAISTTGSAATVSHGVFAEPVGVALSDVSGAMTLRSCLMAATSRTGRAPGVRLDNSAASVLDCQFVGTSNLASTANGTLDIIGGAPTVTGNLFARNYLAIEQTDGAARYVNNTLVANRTGMSINSASPTLVGNNILALNTSYGVQIIYVQTTKPSFVNNTWYQNGIDVQAGTSPIGANGNLHQDPKFRSSTANFRLSSTSPCIDTGDDSLWPAGLTDLDGKARPQGAHVDRGAYEYTASSFALADAAMALRMAGGLQASTVDDVVRLGVTTPGRIDLRDGITILRDALGIE